MPRVFILALVVISAGFIPARAAEEPWLGQGTVIPSKNASLRAPGPRTITKLLRDIGSFAKKGDVLVQFDEESARVALNLTQLALKKSELTLKDAEAKAAVAKVTAEDAPAVTMAASHCSFLAKYSPAFFWSSASRTGCWAARATAV